MRKKLFIRKLLKYISVALLPMFFLFTSIYLIVYINISSDIREYTQKISRIGNAQLESILDIGSDQYLVFNSNHAMLLTIKKMVSEKEMDFRDLGSRDAVYSILNSSGNSIPYVKNIYLYLDNPFGYYLRSSEKLQRIGRSTDQQWLELYRSHVDGIYWIEKRQTQLDVFGKMQTIISIFKKFTSTDGVMVINMIPDQLIPYLDAIQSYKNEAIIITNQGGEILFCNTNAQKLGLTLSGTFMPDFTSADKEQISISSVKYKYTETNSQQYDLNFITLVPHTTIYKVLYSLIPNFILLITAACMIALVASYVQTRQSFCHIDYILENLQLAEHGGTPFTNPHKYQDEYDLILDNILKTFVNHSLLKEKMNAAMLRQRSAEMLALQLQINPHFLFNTLQAIKIHSSKANEKHSEASDLLIDNLSDILKYSLENTNRRVTLTEEIDVCKKYVAIQHSRYKTHFYCFWEYADELLGTLIPHLLLQPIIENSLHHGLKKLTGRDGMLKIKVWKNKQNEINIAVIDNGVGIPKELLERIRKRIYVQRPDLDFKTHIGLLNVNMRLYLLYGEEAQLRIASKAGIGTMVTFRLPEK